jgi:hypothetical protein
LSASVAVIATIHADKSEAQATRVGLSPKTTGHRVRHMWPAVTT